MKPNILKCQTKYLKSKNTDKETQEYANAYYKQIADNTEVKT